MFEAWSREDVCSSEGCTNHVQNGGSVHQAWDEEATMQFRNALTHISMGQSENKAAVTNALTMP
eukprot:scaffold1446_cov77-Skeletonema_marinoi.AAC.4